jgi:hypothetical protein
LKLLPLAPVGPHNRFLTCDNRAAGAPDFVDVCRAHAKFEDAMALEIHAPEVEMGGKQLIRVSNKDRPMSWVTFHFDSAADAIAAHEQLSSALSKAVKVEWP